MNSLPVTFGYEWRTIVTEELSLSGSVEYLRNIATGAFGKHRDYREDRAGADPEFSLVRSTFQAGYTWPAGWAARTAAYVQLANEPLTGPFAFSLGGPLSVRALNSGEVSGDRGVDLRAELFTPYIFADTFASSAFGVFTDYGATGVENAERAGVPPSDTALGIGAGWSWRGLQGAELDLDVSYLADGSIIGHQDLHGSERWRAYFVLSVTF